MLVLQNFDVAGAHKTVDHEHHHPIQVGGQGLVALGDPKPAARARAHFEHGRLGPAARKALGTAQHGFVLGQGEGGPGPAVDVDFGQLGQLADPLARKRQFEQLAHDHQVLRQGGGRRPPVAQALDQVLHSVGIDHVNGQGAHQGQDVQLQAVAQNAHRGLRHGPALSAQALVEQQPLGHRRHGGGVAHLGPGDKARGAGLLGFLKGQAHLQLTEHGWADHVTAGLAPFLHRNRFVVQQRQHAGRELLQPIQRDGANCARFTDHRHGRGAGHGLDGKSFVIVSLEIFANLVI